MAAHKLKIYISIFFSWFYIRKYLKCLEQFSYWLRKYVLWFKSMSFCNHWLEPTYFFGFKRVDPNFFKFGYLVENWYKILSFAGEIAVSLDNSFSTAQISPIWPRQLKTHIAFLMFPIIDTNLWVEHKKIIHKSRIL